MNKGKHKNTRFYIKLISIILSLFLLLSTPVYSVEYILDSDIYYIESSNLGGFIEPTTTNSGAIVAPNGYNYTTSQLWEFSTYIFGTNAYFTIKSSKGTDLYLRYVDTDSTYSIKVDSNINIDNPSDDYLWKLTKLEECAFYDLYTIVSKKDITKYLTITSGYLDVITGIGLGREQATRYWKFYDITESVKKMKPEHKINGDSYMKPITFASTYDELRFDRYFGSYINDAVIDSCENISNANIYEYDRFNDRGLLEIISESSICVISTHGSNNSLLCQNYEDETETFLRTGYIEEQIPDGYFRDTQCVLVFACEAAHSSTDNIALRLHEKGVQTVVAFEQTIYFKTNTTSGSICSDEAQQLYAKRFLYYLGEGKTVEKSIESAYKDINEKYVGDSSIKDDNPKIHEHGFFNLDSDVIYGNKKLKF